MCLVVSDSAAPWTAVCPVLLSMEISRILEWVFISYTRGASQPKDQTSVSCVSCIGRRVFYPFATWCAIKLLYYPLKCAE